MFVEELGDGGEEGLVLQLLGGLSRGMADAWRAVSSLCVCLNLRRVVTDLRRASCRVRAGI